MPQLTGTFTSYPARVSFVAYAITILVGGVLLTLPVARQADRPPISLVDGLFTATSACCVTGLTVRSTVNDFSGFGQGVILVLIQLGGLGIMTITTLAAFQIGGQATLRQRAVVADTLGTRSGWSVSSRLSRVVLPTPEGPEMTTSFPGRSSIPMFYRSGPGLEKPRRTPPVTRCSAPVPAAVRPAS